MIKVRTKVGPTTIMLQLLLNLGLGDAGDLRLESEWVCYDIQSPSYPAVQGELCLTYPFPETFCLIP